MRVAKEFSFSGGEIDDWCEQFASSATVHTDNSISDHELFEGRVVPPAMLLGAVSGLVSQWGETQDGIVVISRISSTRFDKPVYSGSPVEISVSDEQIHSVEIQGVEAQTAFLKFEATDGDGDDCFSGFVTVYLV